MDTIARLDEFAVRASKLSDKQAREAAAFLLKLYSDTQDKAKIADYIMRLKSTVCLFFFESAVATLEPERIASLHAAVREAKAYKNNPNNVAATRGFIISAVLIKSRMNTARAVLVQTLADVERDGKFSDTVINVFNVNVVEYCGGLKAISVLGEREWKRPEARNRFNRFMNAVSDKFISTTTAQNTEKAIACDANNQKAVIEPSIEEVTSEKKVGTAAAIMHVEPSSTRTDIRAQPLADDLLKALTGATREANTLLQTLTESNGTIANLRRQTAERDSRISSLSAELHERDKAIENLRREISKLEQGATERDNRISDLTERLKASLHMDSISQNQELITLKNNLSKSLTVEYADYLIGKEAECDPDNYGALIDSLTRIFKIIRRFGISID